MSYPGVRLRRLRQREPLRRLIRETRLSVDQLVMPLFVRAGRNVRAAIPSMPGQFQLSVDQLVKECQELHAQRIPAVLLFGIPQHKDDKASHAYAKDGVVQQACAAIKAQVPDLLVITDVCLCAYTTHGHCGVVTSRLPQPKSKRKSKAPLPQREGDFAIDNDATLELLAKTAVSHAQAGADMVAPSDMMDGRVGIIRKALDQAEFAGVPIMSYAAKYASALYGPFREAVSSTPAFGDRKSYQMDVANVEEALREVALDLEEGADIVMVKPALAYLDVITRIKQRFNVPVAAFNVSGEYAMVKAAAARGWLVERPTWLELLLAMRRAGADVLITYWAKEASKFLQER
jgi:porphobilinogen synthase